MPALERTMMTLRQSEDVVRVRQAVRQHAIALNFTLIDQTKIVTAVSEIARNTLEYGKGGEVEIAPVMNGVREGLRIRFTDQGPGIENVERAMSDGYTSGSGLGLGLGGAKRLAHEFAIRSQPGGGTTVELVRWRL